MARAIVGHPRIAPHIFGKRRECAILAYHRVTSRKAYPVPFDPNRSIAVHRDAFEAQLRHLSQNMKCLSMDELIGDLERGAVQPQTVTLTFDDGYADNLVHALPLLEKYKVPATVYITTELLNGAVKAWWYELEDIVLARNEIELCLSGHSFRKRTETFQEKDSVYNEIAAVFKSLPSPELKEGMRMLRVGPIAPSREEIQFLSDGQLQQLARSPWITIGAHTVSHPSLSSLSKDRALEELQRSKVHLEQLLGRPVVHCAYPFGLPAHANTREYTLAREAGYASAVTTVFGRVSSGEVTSRWSLPRLHIDYDDSLGDFRYKIAGAALARRGGWYAQ